MLKQSSHSTITISQVRALDFPSCFLFILVITLILTKKSNCLCVDVALLVCVHQVRSRGLPDDHAGPIRIIDIEGVDANMCCGTHVSNLSHLQVKI